MDNSEEYINRILPENDVIIGGFPCQGFSVANINRSMKDERNFLYEQLLKAISIKLPKYFMLENVKGLENMDKGLIIKMIMDDLEIAGTPKSKFFPKNGPGYKVYYGVFNALNFGVPQNRERVIILGIRNDVYDEALLQPFLKVNSGKYDYRKVLSFPLSHSFDATELDPEKPIDKVNKLYKNALKQKIKPSLYNFSSKLYSINVLSSVISDLPLEPTNEIYNHEGSACVVKINNRVGNRATKMEKYAPTIMGRGSGTGGPLIPPHPKGHRRFTVREVARIQTFPDNFIFRGSISAAYRQIGNAVPVLMAYNLAKIFNHF
jgi:DNA (cytosine-5)-methyltransferase 1